MAFMPEYSERAYVVRIGNRRPLREIVAVDEHPVQRVLMLRDRDVANEGKRSWVRGGPFSSRVVIEQLTAGSGRRTPSDRSQQIAIDRDRKVERLVRGCGRLLDVWRGEGLNPGGAAHVGSCKEGLDLVPDRRDGWRHRRGRLGREPVGVTKSFRGIQVRDLRRIE